MERSTTPRASQQQQQLPPPPLPQASQPGGGAPRRFKNRSRSGSEELSQIVAQAAARAPLANGFWPLGDYTSPSSRPQSATPTPNTVHRAAAADGEQGRATSPTGLLGWVRTAFMLGPSGRTLASKIDEHADEHDGYDDGDGGLQKPNDDPIFRNQTPLLPGILPSFHHIDRQKRLEPPIEVPASQRSSLDGGGSSVMTHDSLETYDGAARRGSSVSTASTASTNSNGALRRSGERDSDDSDNDEDVYAPFAQRQQLTHTSHQPLQTPAAAAAMNGSAPILVRPTARREPLGFEVPLDAESETAPSAGPLDRFKFSINGPASRHAAAAPAKTSNHALSISEAQGTGEYVNDTTEQLTAVPDLVLSPASASQSNDARSGRAAKANKSALSPLAGWIDVDSSNANTPRPASRNDDGPATVRSSESDERRPAEARIDVSFGQRIEGALASRAARQNGDSSAAALQVVVTTSDGTTAQGDGEELSDVMGRPKSPEELLQNRQSRESVVLGSRGASVRAGHGRSRAVSSSKKLVEEEGDHVGRGSRLRAASDMTSYVASTAGVTEESPTPSTPAAGTLRRRSSATSPMSKVRAAGRSPRPSTSAGDAADRSRLLQGSESSNGLAPNSPSTPRSRGALAFLSRRGEVAAQTRKVDTQSADANNVNSPSATAAGLKTPFWRLGRKSQSKGAAPDDDAEHSPAPVTPSKAKRLSTNTSSLQSSAKSKRVSVTSTATGSASNGPSSACPLQGSNSDSLAKVNKSARGALGPAMQPKQIRVRSRNKPSRDREFGTMYLAQELFLGHSAPPLVRRVTPPHASPKATSHDGHDVQSQNGSASPPSTANNDSGFGECASSDGHSAPQSNGGAHSKRRATWAMRFSLDGRHLAVAGQDAVIRIYAVLDTPTARQQALDEVCGGAKANAAAAASTDANGTAADSGLDEDEPSTQSEDTRLLVFSPEPVREFRGHSSDVLDLSWSKGGFLLSASMDKTARVWHLSRPSSLAAFVHGDFVTAAVFHPRDDRFFLSGSLDGKIRLWNISAKKVHASQQVPGLITACSFTHSGSHVCVGTFSGAALFYRTDSLSFVSSVAVRSSSGCGGNGKHQKGGRKVTAIEPILPDAMSEQASRSAGDDRRGERVLITSNDSRVRAYDLSTQSFVVRFKAKTYNNRTSQIRATLSDDNAFIIAGSETVSSSDGGQIHIWSCSATLFDVTTKSLLSKLATGSLNAMAAANQRTTSLLRRGSTSARRSDESSLALPDGATTPSSKSKKKTNDTVLEDSVEYFTAHASTVTCAIMAPMGTSKLLRQANDPIQLRSEVVLRARLEESNVGGSLVGLADSLVGLPVYLGKTMYTALFTPLRLTTGGIGANTAATRAAQQSPVQHDDAAASLNGKLNHVLVSVDDNAVVRVWRSDSLNTMSV